MARLVSGVADETCANCYGGGVTKMDRLPRLNGVYMCPVCSGTEYYIPEQAVDQQPIVEEEVDY